MEYHQNEILKLVDARLECIVTRVWTSFGLAVKMNLDIIQNRKYMEFDDQNFKISIMNKSVFSTVLLKSICYWLFSFLSYSKYLDLKHKKSFSLDILFNQLCNISATYLHLKLISLVRDWQRNVKRIFSVRIEPHLRHFWNLIYAARADICNVDFFWIIYSN